MQLSHHCPTILEGGNADELVIVRKLNPQILAKVVNDHLGQDEIAVTIPKSLLLEAAKALS